jgi:hypothetical protein
MANIEVPRTEVCKLLGLPSDVDEETLNAEFQKAITRLNAAKEAEAIAAAEARLVDEDKRIVAAAVAAGKFGPQRAQFWIDACKRDRANNRAVIASLHPVLADLAGIDPEAERVQAQIMARLGPGTAAAADGCRVWRPVGWPARARRPRRGRAASCSGATAGAHPKGRRPGRLDP